MKATITKLKKRWNAKETRVGRWIKIFFGYFLGLCVACGSILEFTHLVPEDWIPQELKFGIAILAFIGFVVGKMSKAKEDGAGEDQS